ncbi:Hypothetical protein NTJ_05860 [Nesidiocoris tenuis]|uniref:Uncharacterized protein n=1 Tax=Nesidiocoris tenuis TaxID=355587 RepID=A0ABN7ALD5_9HEMI|nr:Hypothetical protein NTJ_05860 [Nesidiocoris tenuis]
MYERHECGRRRGRHSGTPDVAAHKSCTATDPPLYCTMLLLRDYAPTAACWDSPFFLLLSVRVARSDERQSRPADATVRQLFWSGPTDKTKF